MTVALASLAPIVSCDEASLVRALAGVKNTQRFLGLTILGSESDGDEGVVVFRARIFERGADRSFTERSRFRRTDGRWRYEGGDFEPPPT